MDYSNYLRKRVCKLQALFTFCRRIERMIFMFCLIAAAFVSVLFGVRLGIGIGLNMKSKQLDDKKVEIMNLMVEVRKKNNEMLTNFSKVAHMTTNTEGQWTEVDDFLMPMWME